MKDPAFLFYSKDFYEGTRTMLPEERACYLDLIIYQHQNGGIPANDLKRVLMYCNGIDNATLIATLNAKFTLCDGFYINKKLSEVINERKEFSQKQSTNGFVGNFWKKAKSILDSKSYLLLKSLLYKKSNNEVFDLIKDKVIDKEMLENMINAKRNAMRTHLADEDEDAITNINNDISISNINPEISKKIEERLNEEKIYHVDEIKDFMLSNENSYWFETYCMNNRLSRDNLIKCIDEFILNLKGQNKLQKNKQELFTHFYNWYKKNGTNQPTNTENNAGKKTVFQA